MTEQTQTESVPGAAALVIRVWREKDDAAGLKARITQRPDLGADTETTTVVASPEAVYREVRVWLEEFIGRTAGQA
ncbi:hypothetical protein ACGFIF_22075 [Kribbella sp. NPDC049174]|uniref:hypothetical protein n=1 Tax=Kribbella sp. NPDC049174 TaxID=3364112 RepID=UPI00371EEF05